MFLLQLEEASKGIALIPSVRTWPEFWIMLSFWIRPSVASIILMGISGDAPPNPSRTSSAPATSTWLEKENSILSTDQVSRIYMRVCV